MILIVLSATTGLASGGTETAFPLRIVDREVYDIPPEMRKEAERGNAFMQGQVGALYWLDHNYKDALKWLEAGAAQGDGTAQYWLAVMYMNGDGVPQNYLIAITWFRKAAYQGHSGAQLWLGHFYEKGMGVPRSDIRAHMWFNVAHANGYPDDLELERTTKNMGPAEIAEAQEMARVCHSSGYKLCD